MVTNAKVTVDDVKKSAATAASTVKAAAANAPTAAKKAVEEVKKEAAKAEKTATKAKATVAKKATAAKKTATKAATKAAAKAKKTVATTAVVQYQGREFTEAECLKKAQAQFKKDYKKEVLEEINIYIKPEENKIYYVANKDRVGSVDL
ncbi:MAG: DNA-binding protein [Pseudobutyrivibrio ruminis]|nr:DNA-binding protein [Pseudobutyrivibrio ruminis]MBO6129061.1 DNA-binding protein [Pseudobutyrivibrio sp.]